jgi:putative tricarboxylic transport membrane protein
VDLIAGLSHGFAVLFSPSVLAAGAGGLLAGLIAGFLPALSPVGALALAALAAPWIGLSNIDSLVVFVVAFAFGTLYGRTLAAINLVAGMSAATPLVPSARPALIVTAIVAIAVALAPALLVGPALPLVLQFGPAELSAMIAFLLLAGAAFSSGSTAGALAAIAFGLLLRLVGEDIETGLPRLTFGIPALQDGFSVIELALGLFVIANCIDDVMRAMAQRASAAASDLPMPSWLAVISAALAGFVPTNGETFAATVAARRAAGRPTLLDPASQGSVAGMLRAALLSDIRYSISLLVLFAWLLPADVITVLLRGSVNAHALLTNSGVNRAPIAALAAATLILAHVVPLALIFGLTGRSWTPIRIDARIVAAPLVILAGFVAWQSSGSDPSAVVITLAFGLVGYFMIRSGLDRALMFFAFAVGAQLEENIRRALLIGRGDITLYLQRPISATLLIIGVLIFVGARIWRWQRR